MDRGAPEYSQTDPASAAQYTPQQQEVRAANYAPAATPSADSYGVYPGSARSGSFPEHIQRQYQPPSTHSGTAGGAMAQATNPSIAASSPTYPAHSAQYSPYTPQQDLQHPYQGHPGGAMYAQPRPDWAGYGGHPQHGLSGYAVSGAQTPTSAAPAGARPGQVGYSVAPHHGHLNQVYSFVPIPGAQQHKRPRRRYEEIERMYKCGWNGCEKAYGTLNHLNAHVTMQSHGQKRTPEEFKEIRKEWKARKKEEENQRKVEDERARASAAPLEVQNPADASAPPGYQQAGRSVQLPPISYQPGSQYQPPAGGVQQLQEYGGSHLQYSGYPASPYGAQNQMYNSSSNPNASNANNPNPNNAANSGPVPKYEH
jgi:hypothetical protein